MFHKTASSIRGRSATPILIFTGIVSLSAVFFLLFSYPKIKERRETQAKQSQSPANNSTAPSNQETPAIPAQPPATTVTQPTPTVAIAPAQQAVFARVEALMTDTLEKMRSGRIAEVAATFDKSMPPARSEAFTKLFVDGAFRPTATATMEQIGRMGVSERWRLAVEKAPTLGLEPVPATPPTPPVPNDSANSPTANLQGSGPLPPPPVIPSATVTEPAAPADQRPSFVEFDTKITREEGAKIQNLRFSPGLLALAAADLQSKGMSASTPDLQDAADPLGISFDFLQDLLGRQFQAARGTTDPAKLTHEKLAGLCIVFEEGGYSLVPGQGLNVTSVNDQSAWTIVRVKGGPDQTSNEFGIEMAKAADGSWKVNALNFDKMLQSYAQSTEAGKVYYTPVVASPGGGESLVVYFEYDKAELTPRASRQLEIVGGLLKSDSAKKLRISGHTDSTGSEDYNVILSRKRAEIVKQTLQNLGVNPAQIIEQAVGEAMPLDPNIRTDGTDNPEGRSRNRRTEIYLDF